jgi:hypothetical protein
MARNATPRSSDAIIRAMRRALSEVAATAPQAAMMEGEMYVCSVCEQPLKVCQLKRPQCCAAMMREGTKLKILRSLSAESGGRCLSCGEPLPARLLQKDPFVEVCSNCRTKSLRIRPTKD